MAMNDVMMTGRANPAPRKYMIFHNGLFFEVVTTKNVPKLLRFHGVVCTTCGSAYPEDGSIDAAMQFGCDCCRGNRFANVYDDVDGVFRFGDE